jgi:hypothetical protein
LRTIVNEIPKYITKKAIGATSKDIGQILVDRKLSKTSILETGDKLKRARDHANNASFLGLLVPIRQDHEFAYRKSVFGEMLSKYTFQDECPKDLHESAIFTDRMMRLKLTNAYDSRNTYSKFHSRPFLNILTILKHQRLHISQVHYLLSITKDISSNSELMKNIVKTFSKYPMYEDDAIADFLKDFKITSEHKMREIGRSTKPLLDWAQQVGLLGLQEDKWCFITEKGLEVQKFYSSLKPIWFDEMGFDPTFPSSLLLVYMCAYIQNREIDPQKLSVEASENLNEMNSKFDLWNQSLRKLRQPIDFDLNYDIPFEWRESVLGHISKLKLGAVDANEISLWTIAQIEQRLSTTGIEKTQGELSKALGISIPRRECFQTDLEWDTCIKLRLFQLPATPYQGEFEGETDLPMATSNPDVVVRNSLKVLVECKSANEWGKVVVLDKRVGGELHMYQDYAEEINANSSVFVCDVDRFDENRFIPNFEKIGDKLDRIVLVIWSFLDKIQRDQTLLKRFIRVIGKPRAHSPKQRILA